MIDSSFWKDRKIFLTGHTGFKGSWLSLWLGNLGAKVTGYALKPPTDPAIFDIAAVKQTLVKSIHGDIRDVIGLTNAMRDAEPSIVIHMAAQSLVSESYSDPLGTYSTNVMGTVNLLEAVRNTPSVRSVLNITSDKCYENKEQMQGYSETDSMGGYDPYSSSKGCSELVSSAYHRSFLEDANIALATARAGNVIGGGDWASNRIVPDAIRAFVDKSAFQVRNPEATRPWQHVLEPLSGYLMLCQQLGRDSRRFTGGWNFGANEEDTQTVSNVADLMVRYWGENAQWQRDSRVYPHEASQLKLDCSKSKGMLDWSPIWELERAVEETTKWYKNWLNQEEMHEFSLRQIENYQNECGIE